MTPRTAAHEAAPLTDLERAYFADTAPIYREDSGIEPLIDGEAYFRAVHEAIEATEPGDLIYMLSWWFDPHCLLIPAAQGGQKELGRQLVDKVVEGVDVRLILWVNPLSPGPTLWSFGTVLGPAVESFTDHSVVERNIYAARLLRDLEAPEGPRARPPLADRVLLDWSGTWTSSHHQKAVVVSNRGTPVAFLAGMDFAPIRWDRFHHPRRRCFLKAGGRQPCNWHDAGIKLTGAATKGVMETFTARWRECESLPPREYSRLGRSESYNPPPPYPPLQDISADPVSAPGRSVQVLRSFGRVKIPSLTTSERWSTLPTEGVFEIRDTLISAIRAARLAIYVECQFLNREESVLNSVFPPGPFFKHSFVYPEITAALNRGVKVIFVTSGRGDPYDGERGPINTALSQTIQTSILDQIAPEFRHRFVLYRVNYLTVHSKVVLIDDVFLSIGSANFFDRSLDGTDTELTVAAVDTGTLVRDLRVRLWADHLRIDPDDPAVQAGLGNLEQGLAIWRPGVWGSPPPLPESAVKPVLRLIGPPDPEP
ncbi:MAG: phospholipase D-like domain-containing protein [Nitrospiria bacterium]